MKDAILEKLLETLKDASDLFRKEHSGHLHRDLASLIKKNFTGQTATVDIILRGEVSKDKVNTTTYVDWEVQKALKKKGLQKKSSEQPAAADKPKPTEEPTPEEPTEKLDAHKVTPEDILGMTAEEILNTFDGEVKKFKKWVSNLGGIKVPKNIKTAEYIARAKEALKVLVENQE